jgi:enamine deaminase RidA (YjgF/YER057c/UK114 family)
MGYSRAVRSGNYIAITGTVGINSDGTYPKTVGEQTQRSLAIIRAALEALGGRLEHIIRTRMFVTDVSKWQEIAKVHGEVFKEIRPTTSILEVARLIDADAQIEIEADAIVT